MNIQYYIVRELVDSRLVFETLIQQIERDNQTGLARGSDITDYSLYFLRF